MLTNRVFIEVAAPDAPVQGRNPLCERAEGFLKRSLRLADSARSGVTKTARLPAARQRRMHSSAIRVLPALVGSDTTKSSDWSLARDAASICDGHRSISAFDRDIKEAINSSRM